MVFTFYYRLNYLNLLNEQYLEDHLRIGIDSLKQLINKGETVKHLYFDYQANE